MPPPLRDLLDPLPKLVPAGIHAATGRYADDTAARERARVSGNRRRRRQDRRIVTQEAATRTSP
ncbi:MAG: hypothetical protein ABSA97_07875 [Verrucomicrobiia bacterium]